MQYIITTDTQDCIKEGYDFVSFGSNCYSDSVATLTYKSEGKTEEKDYGKKANPAYTANQLVQWGLSAPFLTCEPQLVDGIESNQEASDFYNAVRQAVLAIGTYKVAVAVDVEDGYDHTTGKWGKYTYTPFFLRSSGSSREALVMTLPVETDYNDSLTSNTVVSYVDQFRLAHQKTIEEKVLAAQQAVLVYEQGRTQVAALMAGATFLRLDGNVLRFISTEGNEFSVYATMIDYDECALSIGGIDI